MTAEESLQEPASFEEVSVSLIEEKEFTLDPYLFALNGNNIQQYCTMLSWLELQNPKPEMFLESEQGSTMPLSLVQMAEEFEVLPCSYPDDGVTQTEQFEPPWQESAPPLVRLQYNFVLESEGGVLQRKPSSGLTHLQARNYESVSTGGSLCMSPGPPKGHPDGGALMEDLDAAAPQEESSRQPMSMFFTVVEGKEEMVPQGPEQSSTQDVSRFIPLPGSNSGKDGHCYNHGIGETLTTQVHTGVKSHPSCNVGHFPEPLQIHKEAPSLCPNCGRKLSMNLNPFTHQLAPSQEKPFQCPDCGHRFSCSAAIVAGHPIDPMDEWEGLFRQLSLGPLPSQTGSRVEKPFKCPDCGKGFFHRSSIPRHQRLHRKENSSPDFGQDRRSGAGLSHLPYPKTKPIQRPDGGMSSVSSSAKKPRHLHGQSSPNPNGVGEQVPCLASEPGKDQAPAKKPFLCSLCGKRFTVKWTMDRHQLLHAEERPFKCLYCDKSYIQKSHLKRHGQQKHATSHEAGSHF